jgi:hypothetical protein
MGEEGSKVKVAIKTGTDDEEEVEFRLPNPPEFFGERSFDTCTVHDWVILLRQHILARKIRVNSAQAVRFATLYLRRSALTWYNDNKDTLPKDYDRFKAKLVDAFAPVSQSVLARDRLKRLVHRDSLEKYCDLFRKQAMLVTDMSPTDKVERFVDGLQPWLRKHVRTFLVDRAKDDIDLVIRAAFTLHCEMRKDKYTNDPSSASRAQVKALDARPSDPVRRCYKCGSTEHLRAQCPQVRKGRGRKPGTRGDGKGQGRQSNA